jgi:Domain of unknown function (DUF397)
MSNIDVPAGSWRKSSITHANNACVEVAPAVLLPGHVDDREGNGAVSQRH